MTPEQAKSNRNAADQKADALLAALQQELTERGVACRPVYAGLREIGGVCVDVDIGHEQDALYKGWRNASTGKIYIMISHNYSVVQKLREKKSGWLPRVKEIVDCIMEHVAVAQRIKNAADEAFQRRDQNYITLADIVRGVGVDAPTDYEGYVHVGNKETSHANVDATEKGWKVEVTTRDPHVLACIIGLVGNASKAE